MHAKNYWKFPLLALFALWIKPLACQAQDYFPDRLVGTWEGRMDLLQPGGIGDTVQVRFEVARLEGETAWTWRTSYLSLEQPVVKDYVLRIREADKGFFATDEGDGIVLFDYLFGNKLYSVFTYKTTLLTASYEYLGDRLIFEVTLGKALEGEMEDIQNYSIDQVQRVVYQKVEAEK